MHDSLPRPEQYQPEGCRDRWLRLEQRSIAYSKAIKGGQHRWDLNPILGIQERFHIIILPHQQILGAVKTESLLGLVGAEGSSGEVGQKPGKMLSAADSMESIGLKMKFEINNFRLGLASTKTRAGMVITVIEGATGSMCKKAFST